MNIIKLFYLGFYLVDGSHTTAIGYEDTVKWIHILSSTYETLMFQYNTDERTTIILLNCSMDKTEKFEALCKNPMLFHKFRLTHKYACWNGCHSECNQKRKYSFLLLFI